MAAGPLEGRAGAVGIAASLEAVATPRGTAVRDASMETDVSLPALTSASRTAELGLTGPVMLA